MDVFVSLMSIKLFLMNLLIVMHHQYQPNIVMVKNK